MSKLDPHFTLKHPTGDKASEIRLRICYDRKECIYHLVDPVTRTPYKILPQLWDRERQQPINKKKIPTSLKGETSNVIAINTLIQKIKGIYSEIIDFVRVNNITITNDWLKKEINERLGVIEKIIVEPLTVSQFILQIVDEMKVGKLLIEKSKKQYSKETINQYINLQKSIYYFDKLYKFKTVFDKIDRQWYDNYIRFLFDDIIYIGNGTDEQPEYERERCETNYAGNFIKNLKRIMKLAYYRGVSSNMEHNAEYFTKPSAPTFGVFLSESEIRKIYALELTGENEKYDKYRDLFLMGCYTGLRVSDYTRLQKENFKTTEKGTRVVDILTKKTGKAISLPILYPELEEIAKKYNYAFPKVSNQKINDNIKIIARMVGITETITYMTYKGGKETEEKIEKCLKVTTHTGRRSAVTNFYLHGLNMDDIQEITGQNCKEIIALYIKASSHDKADVVAEKFKRLTNGTNADN